MTCNAFWGRDAFLGVQNIVGIDKQCSCECYIVGNETYCGFDVVYTRQNLELYTRSLHGQFTVCRICVNELIVAE